MNKTVAALLTAVGIQQPPDTGINGVIDKYVQRVGSTYLSPAHTMNVENGPFGVPYWMEGLPIQTCNNMTITAPGPWQKNIMFQKSPVTYTAGQYAIGQAPTRGVYTGVEDGCA